MNDGNAFGTLIPELTLSVVIARGMRAATVLRTAMLAHVASRWLSHDPAWRVARSVVSVLEIGMPILLVQRTIEHECDLDEEEIAEMAEAMSDKWKRVTA